MMPLHQLWRLWFGAKCHRKSRTARFTLPAVELLEDRRLLTIFYWNPIQGNNWADPQNWLSVGNGGTLVRNIGPGGNSRGTIHFFPGGSVQTVNSRQQIDYTNYTNGGYPTAIAMFGGPDTANAACTVPARGTAPLFLAGLDLQPGYTQTVTLNAPVTVKGPGPATGQGPYYGMLFTGTCTVEVNQVLTVSASARRFLWQSGTFSGSSLVNVMYGATLNGSATKTISGPSVNFRATTSWEAGNMAVSNGGTLGIYGTFYAAVAGGQIYTPTGGGTQAQVIVGGGGVFQSNVGADEYVEVSAKLTVNAGSVQVQSGSLYVTGSSNTTSRSGYNVAAGASLYFTGMADKMFSGTRITGAGQAYFQSYMVLNGNLTVQNVIEEMIPLNPYGPVYVGGVVSGNGTLTINGAYQWHSGNIEAGGAMTVAANAQLLLAASGPRNVYTPAGPTTLSLARSLVIANNGTVRWQAGNVAVSGNATITNNGRFVAEGPPGLRMTGGSANTFTVSRTGVISIDQGVQGGSHIFQLPLIVNGLVVASASSIEVSGYQVVTSGTIELNGGSLTADSGLLEKGGTVTVASAESINVTGTYRLSGGTLTVSSGASLSATTLQQTGGTAAIAGTASISNANIDSGTFHILDTGSVSLSGGYTEAPTDPLVLDLDSTSALMQVAGTVDLAGGLGLNPISGFAPSSTSVITLISNTSGQPVSGVFSGLNEGSAAVTINNVSWDIFYDGNSDGRDVVLEAGNPFTNLPPVANADSATAHSAAVTISVLANDYSPEGYALTVASVGAPSNGTAVVNGNNTVTYTPKSGTQASSDQFTYTISDGHGGTSTGTVSVSLVDTPPIANDFTTTHVTAAVTLNPLANDYSSDGDALTITSVGAPLYGTATINGGSTITYTPPTGASGSTDTFTYTISDGYGGTSTATINVMLGDYAPDAENVSASHVTAAVTLAVLTGDFSAEGDSLTVTSVGTPAYGTATINNGTTVTYTPTTGTNATEDSFTYSISDDHGGTSTGTVSIFIADQPPVAYDVVLPHATVAVTANVLANDYDPDGDNLTVTAVGTPANGTAVINGNNTVTYTPNTGTTATEDSFTYTIADGHGGTSTATVSVFITDQPPVAVDTSVSHATAAVTVNLLQNDYDPDGDTLTVTAVGTPASGTARINGDSTITYTPNTGTTATMDSFSYTIADGHGGTSTATVTVYIADQAPVANDVSASHATAAITVNVLANDWDPDGDALTVTNVGTPANGTVVNNGDGTVTYTPNSGTTATADAFTYTISDGQGGTSSATVSVFIADQPPVAVDAFGYHATAAVTISVLANDYDPDGDKLTVTAVGMPANGSARINADNTVTYTPNTGTTAAQDSFSYTIADGYGGTSTATVTVFIADQPPVANDVSISHATAAVTANVLANDWDPDGDTLTVTSVGTPSHGTAVNNSNGTVTYTPASGTTATEDSFTYTVADGYGGTSTATVSVFIANQPPVAYDLYAPHATVAVTVKPLASDWDPDSDALTVTSVSTPAHGTATINADNSITYTPTSGYNGSSDLFTYTIADGYGGTSSALVFVGMTDHAPVAVNEAFVHVTAAATLAVLSQDYDADGDTLTVTSIGTPAHGTASLNSDGTVTFTPATGYSTDSFSYTIADGYGGTSTGTVSIFSNDQPPVAVDAYAVNVTAAVTINVVANDSDPDGDALTVSSVGTPSHGTVVNNGDGTVTYTPNSGYSGDDNFTYTIADGYGGTSTASVHLEVGDPGPMASNAAATLTGTTAITVAVLPFCADSDGDTLTVTSVGTPTYGTAGINASGEITYTPASANTGNPIVDTFSYTMADGHGGQSSAEVSVTLLPSGDTGPFANDVNAADPGNTAIRIPVLANDADPDSDTLTVTSVGTPAEGTATINGDGTVTYTPSPGATSTDSFSYNLADGHGNGASANVTVTLGGEVSQPIALVSDEVNSDFIGISGASESGTTVTLTTDGASGFTAGKPIVIAGYSGTSAGYNGTWTIATISGTTVTYTDTASGLPTLTNDANGYAISLNTTSDLQPGAGYGHQRSMVDSIAYTFNMPVNLAAGAVTLGTVAPTVLAGTASPATGVPGTQWTSLAGGTVWVMTFVTSGSNTVTGHSIADGVYTAQLNASKVSAAAGGMQMMTTPTVDTFYRLFGDALGTGVIDLPDQALFNGTDGKQAGQSGYLAYLDYNGDGQVNTTDLTAFNSRYATWWWGFATTI